jgi:hypothetical protein
MSNAFFFHKSSPRACLMALAAFYWYDRWSDRLTFFHGSHETSVIISVSRDRDYASA